MCCDWSQISQWVTEMCQKPGQARWLHELQHVLQSCPHVPPCVPMSMLFQTLVPWLWRSRLCLANSPSSQALLARHRPWHGQALHHWCLPSTPGLGQWLLLMWCNVTNLQLLVYIHLHLTLTRPLESRDYLYDLTESHQGSLLNELSNSSRQECCLLLRTTHKHGSKDIFGLQLVLRLHHLPRTTFPWKWSLRWESLLILQGPWREKKLFSSSIVVFHSQKMLESLCFHVKSLLKTVRALCQPPTWDNGSVFTLVEIREFVSSHLT